MTLLSNSSLPKVMYVLIAVVNNVALNRPMKVLKYLDVEFKIVDLLFTYNLKLI